MPGGAIELARAQVIFTAEYAAMITEMNRAQKQFQQVTKSMETSAKGVEKSSSSMARSVVTAAKGVVGGYTDMQRAASKFLRNMTMTTVFLQLDIQYITKLFRDLSKASITGLGLAVGSAAKFEDAFVQVAKVVDMSNAELERLSGNLRKMSLDINVSANQLAELAAMGGRLGVRGVENLTQFTQTVAELQIATNIAGEEGASSLARLMNIMGTSAEDIHRLGSSITDLGNNLATTEAEILDMALRLAGAGKTVGLTASEVLGLAGAMSAVGLRAEMGGSAMSRVLINMSQAVETNSAALSVFARTANMTTREFASLFRRDAVGALQAFIAGLQRLDAAGQNVFWILEDAGASEIRVRDTLLRLFNASEMLGSSIDRSNQAWQENSALTEEVNRRNQTLLAQLGMLWNAVTELARSIGDLYVPALKDAVTWAKAVVIVFNELDPAQKETIARTLALVAAISTAIGIIGSLASVLLTLGVGFLLLSRLVVFFMNPWMVLVSGIGLGIFLLKQWDVNAGEAIVNWLDSMREKLAALSEFVGPGKDVISGMLTDLGAAVASAQEEMPELPQLDIKVPVDITVDRTLAEQSWGEFVAWVQGLEVPEFPEIKYTIPEFDWSPIKESWDEFTRWVAGLEAPELPEDVQEFLDRAVTGFLKSPGGQLAVNVGTLAQEVMAGEMTLKDAILAALEHNISVPLIAGAVSLMPVGRVWRLGLMVASLFTPILPSFVSSVKASAKDIWGTIADAFQAPGVGSIDLVELGIFTENTQKTSRSAGEWLGKMVSDAIVQGIELIPTYIAEFGNVFREIGQQVGDYIIRPFLQGFWEGIRDLPSRVGEAFRDVFSQRQQNLEEEYNRIVVEYGFDPKDPLASELVQLRQAHELTGMGDRVIANSIESLANAAHFADAAATLRELGLWTKALQLDGERLAKLLEDIRQAIETLPFGAELLRAAREAGTLPGLRSGAVLPGTSGPDMFPALLAPGEAVVPSWAVQGGWAATLAWFRSMGVPGFQEGYAPDIAAARGEATRAEAEAAALAKEMAAGVDDVIAKIEQFGDTVTGGIMTGAEFLVDSIKPILPPDQGEKLDEWLSKLENLLRFGFIRHIPTEEAVERPRLRGRIPEGLGQAIADDVDLDPVIREFELQIAMLSSVITNFDRFFAMQLIQFTSRFIPPLTDYAMETAEWIIRFGESVREAMASVEKFSGRIGSSLDKLAAIMSRYGAPGSEQLSRAGSIANLISSLRTQSEDFAYELANIREAFEELFGGGARGKAAGVLGGMYIGSMAGGGFQDTGTGINWVGSIAGGLAGMGIAPALTGGIALASNLVNALAPGKPKDASDQALQQRIKDMNKELKEWGSTYQSANLSFRKDSGFLGWRNLFGNVKWETVGKKAAEEGAKIAERLLASMKNVFGALSPMVGQVLFGGLTEDAFMANVGQQLQTALVEALLAEGPVKEAMQELSAVVAEAIEFGITDDAMDEIKNKAKEAFEAIEGYQEIADEITEAFGNASDEIDQMIDRLGNQLRSAVTSAFNATSLTDFMDDIERQLLLRTRDAFIEAFMESAAMAPLFDSLSTAIGDAVRDGIIDAGEMDAIRDVISQIGEGSAEFFQILDELGLSMEDLGETARGVSESLTNVPEGFRVALHRFNAMTPVELPVAPSIPGTGIPNTGIPNIGRPIWSADSVDTIPLAQTGGIVTRTGAVIVHAGEIIHNPERESGIGNNITMNVTIVSNDPQKIYRELKKLMERENVVKYGTPVAPAPMFNR